MVDRGRRRRSVGGVVRRLQALAVAMIQALDTGKVVWEPLPRQRVALACPAFELGYGGSKGGAKTDFLRASPAPILAKAHEKWLKTGQKQRNCRVAVFRKNLDDLKDFIAKTFTLYPQLDPEMGPDGWHEKAKYWGFTSGATVEIFSLDGPRDHEGHQGNEFVAVLFDEVQYISYEAYAFLVAQVRSADPDYKKMLMVRCTMNPGGPHGDWVKKHFHIDECPEGSKIFHHEVTNRDGTKRTVTRAFVRAYLKDNHYLDADGTYEAQLRSVWGPDEVKMYLDGDFDAVAGAFFSHLLRLPAHFQRSRPLPPTWEMIFGIDWGSSNTACCLWAAVDPDNRLWLIDELHEPGITGSIFGEKMRERYKHQKWCRDRVFKPDDFWGVIDTQAMDRYGGLATAAALIMEKGFRIFPADKLPGERSIGIGQIKERLTLDRNGDPQMIVFEDRCPNLTRALKGIQSCAPIDPDDYDPRSPLAHAIDALRFIAMKYTVRSVIEEHPMDAEVARWNRIIKQQREQQSNDEGRMTGGYGD
jgi:hypothetical protein